MYHLHLLSPLFWWLTCWSAGAVLKAERQQAIKPLKKREKSATAIYKTSAELVG